MPSAGSPRAFGREESLLLRYEIIEAHPLRRDGDLCGVIHFSAPLGYCGYGMSVAWHHPLNSMIYRPPL
jgi:hypothetical protein